MKKLILGLSLIAATASAQTTNNNLRIVQGKVYDIEKSTNWIAFTNNCSSVSGDRVTILTDEKPSVAPTAPHLPWNTFILIQNYPTNPPVAIGTKVSGKIMKVGEGRMNGFLKMEIWDYGTLATNSLPEKK